MACLRSQDTREAPLMSQAQPPPPRCVTSGKWLHPPEPLANGQNPRTTSQGLSGDDTK